MNRQSYAWVWEPHRVEQCLRYTIGTNVYYCLLSRLRLETRDLPTKQQRFDLSNATADEKTVPPHSFVNFIAAPTYVVLITALPHVSDFRGVKPRRWGYTSRRFEGSLCLHLQGEAAQKEKLWLLKCYLSNKSRNTKGNNESSDTSTACSLIICPPQLLQASEEKYDPLSWLIAYIHNLCFRAGSW
jgi:hypothetical protein